MRVAERTLRRCQFSAAVGSFPTFGETGETRMPGLRTCIAAAALLAAAASVPVTPAAAETGALARMTADGRDVAGWGGIAWGMTIEEALALFDADGVVRQEPIEVAGCYFRFALPLRLAGEKWQVWLCQDRHDDTVIAVNIEKGFGGTFFDGDHGTQLFDTLLAEFTARYGPAHRFWEQCHNVRWNATMDYKWFFPSTTVSLVYRDVPERWAGIRFERPTGRPDFGPGVCVKAPVDLRG